MDTRTFESMEKAKNCLFQYRTHILRVINISERLHENLEILSEQSLANLVQADTINHITSIWEEASEALDCCTDDIKALNNAETEIIEGWNKTIEDDITELDSLKKKYGHE